MLENKQTHRNDRELINLGLAETSIASYFSTESINKSGNEEPNQPKNYQLFSHQELLAKKKISF